MRKVKFCKGNFYHIYNRGVEKREIFRNDDDRWRFLQGMFMFNDEKTTANLLWQIEKTRGAVTFGILRDFLKINNGVRNPLVSILADCLMPNHFHLLIQEIKDGGISQFMHKLGIGYTRYFNNKYERVGGLCQGTFKAVLVDNERYLQYLLAYINVINPAELIEPNLKEKGISDFKRIMQFVEEYPWSTNQEYLDKRSSMIIDKSLLRELFGDSKRYKDFIEAVLSERKFNEISHLFLE